MSSESHSIRDETNASRGQSSQQTIGEASSQSFSVVSSSFDSGCTSTEKMDIDVSGTTSNNLTAEVKKSTPKKESTENRKRYWKKRRPRRKNVRKPRNQGHQDWEGEKTPVQSSPMNLDQEQEKRAKWVKLRMLRYGKPYAPYNTTQYLMEDQKSRDPQVGEILFGSQESDQLKKPRHESFSTRDGSESDEFYSSPDDEHDFQRRQFSEIYETVHAERISSMSKRDLVQEFLMLEDKAEKLEKQLNDAQTALNHLQSRTQALSEESSSKLLMPTSNSSVMSRDDEVSELKAEVERLLKENQRLKDLNSSPGLHNLPLFASIDHTVSSSFAASQSRETSQSNQKPFPDQSQQSLTISS